MSHSPDKLTQKQRLRIQTRHKVSIERHGYQPQALYWSNREIQEIRFQNLISILPNSHDLKNQAWSLLDVGCGFADLIDYLASSSYLPNYTGLDLSPDMVLAAQSLHPKSIILEGELVESQFVDSQFDYVMLSGALNEVVETEIENTAQFKGCYAKSVIKEMYRICKKGVAFNLLDANHAWVQSRYDLQSFKPKEMVAYCEEFADEVVLIQGYLDNDFTIHLKKQSVK
ncbi:class I SAM-dependent methyltransferase [Thiomicrorhabdus hydrogeniphila]